MRIRLFTIYVHDTCFVLLVVVSMGGSVYVHIHVRVLVVSSKIFLDICTYILTRLN